MDLLLKAYLAFEAEDGISRQRAQLMADDFVRDLLRSGTHAASWYDHPDGQERSIYLQGVDIGPYPEPAGMLTDTEQAAHYIGVSADYLARLRETGGGPRFIKLPPGRGETSRQVVYAKRDLDNWMDNLPRYDNSTQAAMAAKAG